MLKFCLNTFLKSRIPYLISGYEEKCLVVIRCCGFAASMQHTYLQTLILQAFTVLQTLIWSEATTRENEVFSSLFQSDNEEKRTFFKSIFEEILQRILIPETLVSGIFFIFILNCGRIYLNEQSTAYTIKGE